MARKKSLKVIINQSIIKIKVCYWILSGKYQHWFISNIDEKNLINLFVGETFEAEIMYCGMQPYVFKKVLKSIDSSISETEIALDKIEFEFNAKNRDL